MDLKNGRAKNRFGKIMLFKTKGIEIRVDSYPDAHKNYSGMISTAYPLNTPPNPPKGGGY